jgi:outer membrane receptor protein involved in Fe transport
MYKITMLIFLCCFLRFGQTYADDPQKTDWNKMSLEDLLNIEIKSAAKISQHTNEAPNVISVVTADQIRSYGWLSLNDILCKQPGFQPSMDYDRRTVTSRGLFEGWNNNHLLLQIDGVPFNDNLYGTAYTWEITPVNFIKSVEIIRGPGSALYGSNATNGVISITTFSAADLDGKTMVQFRLGNVGTQQMDVLTGVAGKLLSLVAGFTSYRTAGNDYLSYDGSGRVDTDGNPAQFMTRDARKNDYFFAKIEGEKELSGLSLQIHQQDWDFQTGLGWLWMIPDFNEAMKESRTMISLAYKPQGQGNFSQEYVLRYQRHDIDWNMILYPNDAFSGYYPTGVREYLNTESQDLFARVQYAYLLRHDAMLLGGVEGTMFLYNGDNEHYSNTNFTDGSPYPGGVMIAQGSWLQWIKDQPLFNVGVYGQFTSGELFGKQLQATLGMRFDTEFFNFNAIDKPGAPIESKSFSQFNPRLGLVFKAATDLSIKLMAGQAFRAPSPAEMFGANTYTLASNLRNLKPETVTTLEAAADWRLSKQLNWRVNAFYTKSENQIAYSISNYNLSTNVYTLSSAGIETELLFGVDRFMGFLNYSFAQRLDEQILDPTIAISKTSLTWAPAHALNLGLTFKASGFNIAVAGHYQGQVARRTSDMLSAVNLPLRPEEVGAWFSADAKIEYQATPFLDLTCTITNVFDATRFLIKNFDYPFDYKMEGIRFLAGVRVHM